MNKLGFSRVEVVSPPEGAYEQLAMGKRMIGGGLRIGACYLRLFVYPGRWER